MTQTVEAMGVAPSRLIAREIRAELGRQGISQRRLAMMIGSNYSWVSRRIGIDAVVDLTFEETEKIAKALNVPMQRLLPDSWLPRKDSNLQPAGYSRRWTDRFRLAA